MTAWTTRDRWCPKCRRWRPRDGFVPGRAGCRTCRDADELRYRRGRVARARAKGLCDRCRKRPVEPPAKTLCPRCRAQARAARLRREARRRAGKRCTRCAAVATLDRVGKWYCRACAQDRAIEGGRWRAKARAAGLCITCRTRPCAVSPYTGRLTQRCEKCLAANREEVRRRRAKAA